MAKKRTDALARNDDDTSNVSNVHGENSPTRIATLPFPVSMASWSPATPNEIGIETRVPDAPTGPDMVPRDGAVPSRGPVSPPEPLFVGCTLEKTNDVLFVRRRSGTPRPESIALSPGSASGGKL